ncbi:MAG: MarR family transcriptional regulator [Ignavibacteriaceae bacterium]|jgi:MarR family 2-MHQ and catechol resistance regulon transcriptional repressor
MGTHYKGTTKEINSLNVYLKFLRASDSIRSRINKLITGKGLTESQFNMLDTLFHLGPLSQSELGKKLLKSGGNITMIVDNLEKRKLVKRERSKNDRRFFTIHLTKRGNNLIEKLFPEILSALINEIYILNEDEQIEFQRVCKLLGLGNTAGKTEN